LFYHNASTHIQPIYSQYILQLSLGLTATSTDILNEGGKGKNYIFGMAFKIRVSMYFTSQKVVYENKYAVRN
jgi:hypothetical protein